MNRQILSCLMQHRLKKLQPFLGHINSFYTSAVTGAQRHSCFDESKDFFKDKLLQYGGVGTKVPIQCLLWYYKDAPPQIRDIFGPCIKEFTNFLSQCPDTFEIVHGSVSLVGCNDLKDVRENVDMENLCKNNCPLKISTKSTSRSFPQESNKNIRVISSTTESNVVTNALMKSAAESAEQMVVSIDCEGMDLGHKGTLSLIQLATTSGEVFIFDVLTCPQMAKAGLKSLLESDRIIKIIHGCNADAANLFAQFGIILRNVFDTQVAQTVLQCQDQGKPVHDVQPLSLNKLCELYNVPTNPLKDEVKKMYVRYSSYWAERPLSSVMLSYAALDVLVLINEQLYGTIASNIKPEYKPLFSELCAEQILWTVLPHEVKLRKKQRIGEHARNKLSMDNVVLSNNEIESLKSLDLTEDERAKLRTLCQDNNPIPLRTRTSFKI